MENFAIVTELDIAIGKKLRERRLELGINQEQLCSATGVSLQHIQAYEQGIAKISIDRLYEFSKFLEIDVNYFFSDSYHETIDNAEDNYIGLSEDDFHFLNECVPAKEIMTLVKGYHAIKDARLRKNILALVQALSKEDNKKSTENEDNEVLSV